MAHTLPPIPKLVPSIKARWIERLRSGELAQTKGTLCKLPANGPPAYCCLGVLHEIAAEDGIVTRDADQCPGYYGYRPVEGPGIVNLYGLGIHMIAWAFGLSLEAASDYIQQHPQATMGAYQLPPDSDPTPTLAGDNDGGMTFPEIAALIEEYL